MLCMKYAILKELIYIFMQCMYNKNIFLRSFNNEINFYLSFVFLSTYVFAQISETLIINN